MVTVLTARTSDPAGYGRIIRDASGAITEIVEEADATDEQRLVDEINSGCYAFDGGMLADAIKRVSTSDVSGQEYLTDVVGILRGDGHRVGTQQAADASEIQGVNDRVQLAQARRIYNDRLLEHWMRAGVTIVDPATTWLDADVILEPDAEIGPSTQLEGRTAIASGARVGPGCVLRDTVVGAGATVINAVCDLAEIGPGRQCRALHPPAARDQAGARHPGRQLRRDEERGRRRGFEGAPPELRGRRGHRLRFEHRGRHGVRQLRRRAEAPHHGGRSRPDRERHDARRAGRDRRWRLHRRRVHHYGERPSRALGIGRARQHNVPGWVARRRAGTQSAAAGAAPDAPGAAPGEEAPTKGETT